MPTKPTAAELILFTLGITEKELALHELNIAGVSQTAASARLRELRREGLVYSKPVEGQRYTSWGLTENGKLKAAGLIPL